MKVVILMCVLTMSVATFVTYDEVGHLFENFARNRRLSKYEKRTLADVFEILRMDQNFSSQMFNNYILWVGCTLHCTSPSVIVSGVRSMNLNTLGCLACRTVADIFFKLVKSGLSDEEISWVLTRLCTSLHVESHKVCKGAVELNLPILRFIITNTPEASPRTFCGLILQTDKNPYDCPYYDPRFEWQVDLPDSTAQKRIFSKTARPLQVALITDVHLDPLYHRRKYEPNADSGEPVGCHRGQNFKHRIINASIYEQSVITKNGDIVLDLSYVPKIKKIRKAHVVKLKKSGPSGYWGDYRNCDTPLWTFNDVIDRITAAHKRVDVVYYIGDTIDHCFWESKYAQNQRMKQHLIQKLRRSFGDEVLVVPVIGNHESQPINQFAPSSVKGNNLNTTWLYTSLAKMWDLPNNARAPFWKYGAYSVGVRPGLKAIVMNSNVAYRYNWWVVYDPLDAKGHLEWLVDELYKAELNGEKVHILSHIPPGEADLTYTWTREYRRIVTRFASTIAAEFNGHLHWDEFKIFYNSEGKASRVAWNGGGVTTFSNFNPNYKIVKFHPHTHEPYDIKSYIFNLTEANLHPKRKPHWFRLYDFKQKFGLPDLSPASMDDLVKRMASDGNDLLGLYVDYSYKMSDARPYCDTDCQLDFLCRTVVTVLWDRQKCEELGLLRSKP